MHAEEALDILREFVADVMAANANDIEQATDTLKRDWPDLAVTFEKAHKLVQRADR